MAALPVDGQPAPVEQPKPTIAVGDFQGVIALSKKAQQHIKFSKIRMKLSDGHPIALSVAGQHSKASGTANITDGKPYGSNWGEKKCELLSAEAKIHDANLVLELTEKSKAQPVSPATEELFAKFGHNAEALQLLTKVAQLAATEKVA